MPPLVVNAAMLSCTMGLGPPMPLTAVPKGTPVTAGAQPLATVADMIPMANIPTFGMCNSPTNPAVIAATSGRPRRPHADAVRAGPCRPVDARVREGGAHAGVPVLTAGSTCQCAWTGTITIGMPGQATVDANV